MQHFKSLRLWQVAHRLTLGIYGTTRAYPQEELYGLTSQTRRSAASIPANIAEGCGRAGKRDFARFLDVASGSANELEYHLILGKDLGLLDTPAYESFNGQVSEIRRMLTSLVRRVRPAEQ